MVGIVKSIVKIRLQHSHRHKKKHFYNLLLQLTTTKKLKLILAFFQYLTAPHWCVGPENFKTVKIVQIGAQRAKIALLTMALPLPPLPPLPPKLPAKKKNSQIFHVREGQCQKSYLRSPCSDFDDFYSFGILRTQGSF